MTMETDSGSTCVGANSLASTTSTTGTSASSETFGVRQRKERKALTIEGQAKIDIENDDKNEILAASVGAVVIKWIATLIIFSLVLGLVAQSKISVLALTERLHRNSNKAPDGQAGKLERQAQLRLFSCLLLVLLIPPIVNLARGVWEAGFRKDLPWPKRRAFGVGFLISVMESVGLCIFVFTVPTIRMDIYYFPLMMNFVFALPILFSISRFKQPEAKRRTQYLVLFLLAAVFFVAAVVLFAIAMQQDEKMAQNLNLSRIWALPVGIACLSFAWLPRVHSYLLKVETGHQVDPELPNDPRDTQGRYVHMSGTDSLGYTSIEDSVNTDTVQIDHVVRNSGSLPAINYVTQTSCPTWKLTIYMSAVKIVITFLFSLLVFNFLLLDSGSVSMSDFASAWDLGKLTRQEIYYMVANPVSGLLGYMVGYMACTTCLHRGGYALPLFLCTPLTFVLLINEKPCQSILIAGADSQVCTSVQDNSLLLLSLSVVCLVAAQVFSTGWLIWSGQSVVKQQEHQLFWMPTYNGVMLEQWMLLARRNRHTDDQHEDPTEKAKRSKIIICTTMYRESKTEMKQLLQSIGRINNAQLRGTRHFESHIIFDGAVKDRNPTEFVLQLVSLVEPTLGIKPEQCCKTQTPYGMTLSWRLPDTERSREGERGMFFTIHLKDNFKVKNKKRWSQVMYMSYVLDFLMQQHADATEEDTYILTTDADVKFTPDNVEALLDLMTRDQSVGAVCARTHPLGSGPLVWYQVFEYAIGHWFQKAAEHVLGSVLCSPGCFSVYRCKALREILPKYATNVEHAFDFLTKDMGEDRWLCTLMVQSGWRIEYCAASENSTYCPEDFEEFYKQRRRWVASTIANIMLLLKEWNLISKYNHRVSYVFLIYQAALLFATLIGPSSVMLVVSGGLTYAWGIEPVATLVLQLVICVAYGIVCIRATSSTQMKIAKFLTFIYSIVMIGVLVGTAAQIAGDFTPDKTTNEKVGNTTEQVSTTPKNDLISTKFPISASTLYILVLAALFIVTGLLHTKEVLLLAHGLWYLLCLPSGYLLLMIYSICNITDRSWGTREEVTKSIVANKLSWMELYKKYFKKVFFCCFKDEQQVATGPTEAPQPPTEPPGPRNRVGSVESDLDGGAQGIPLPNGSRCATPYDSRQLSRDDILESLRLASIEESDLERSGIGDEAEDDDIDDSEKPRDVADWLPRELHKYVPMFRDNGFENTMLISGMTEKELKSIGVKTKAIRNFMLEEIKTLPDFEIQAEVPENVTVWLRTIGLSQYDKAFARVQIKSSKEMEILKSFGREELENELKITKRGHIKRLLKAIEKLRNPTPDERRILETRRCLEVATMHDLKNINVEEFAFWEKLQKLCLFPASKAFSSEEALKVKLGDLRNGWLVIMAVSNLLWIILISTLANKGQLLSVAGSNPVGLVVMVIFSFVLLIQFLAMLVHRLGTLVHFLGRAPYRCGQAYNTSWTFSEKNAERNDPDDDVEARHTAERSRIMAKKRLQEKKKQRNPRNFLKSGVKRHFDRKETVPLVSRDKVLAPE